MAEKNHHRLLIAEDEPKTARSLKQGFEEAGYLADLAFDGETAFAMIRNHEYQLIITDIVMPGANGLDFCRNLRNAGYQTPVIMISALGLTSDKLAGFGAGTDDYLVKPFEFEELLARVQSVLKRSSGEILHAKILKFADIEMNLDTREVVRESQKIVLTAREFDLLEYLIRNKGKVVSKNDIAENVWDLNFDTGTNVVEVYISYLRNKIDKPFEKKYLKTRIGVGYMLKEGD